MKKSTICNIQFTISKSTIHTRCDNCFFSVYITGPCRAVLTCRQKTEFPGRGQIVFLDNSCSSFYPSTEFKLGSAATRRIPLTRGQFALVDADDYYSLVKVPWIANKSRRTFYATGKPQGRLVKMHRVIMNAPGHLVVDHIDHNGLNNCRSNLRLCTHAQNSRNMVPRKAGSKYKGVHWNRDKEKWSVQICLNGKAYRLGNFKNEIEAAKAYDKKAKELHGQFACLNFPGETTTARRRDPPE